MLLFHDLCTSFLFQVLNVNASEIKNHPENGCYVNGLFLEGARWCHEKFCLTESRPKELFTEMAPLWLIPTSKRKTPEAGIYECPVYKTLTRAG